MNRLLVFIFLLWTPTALLQAQQDFEGRVVYTFTDFTAKPLNKPDTFTIWISGGKCKMDARIRSGANAEVPLHFIADMNKDTIYMVLPGTSRYMAFPISLLKQAAAVQQTPVFAGDSIFFYGTTCYKYILEDAGKDAAGKTTMGWYAPAFICKPVSRLTNFPFFNTEGQLALKMETVNSRGVCELRMIATDIAPGPVDAAVFALDEENVDRSIDITVPKENYMEKFKEVEKELDAANKQIPPAPRHTAKRRTARKKVK